MTNKEYLETLDPDDWYDMVYWIFHGYGRQYTDTRSAIIDWLSKDRVPLKIMKGNIFSFCPQCYSIVDSCYKECPYCHAQFE